MSTLPATASQALKDLAVLLGGDAALIADIELAVNDPTAYVARFAERLDERGIDQPRPDLAWYALINGLIDRQRLVELDCRSAAYEVLAGLQTLDPTRAASFWDGYVDECNATVDPDRDLMTDHCARVANRRTEPQGIALAYLELSGDSFLVTMLPPDRLKVAAELARATGIGSVEHVEGKT